ncbi:glycosyltransferase [Pseudoalteromonas sp. AOP31-A2-14]|uniref:glycosyltransferase n=1 Tax=Pseudoalteromonas sp. AOP31-A2-14 TaxID=3457695 RepID=UPI0040369D4D
MQILQLVSSFGIGGAEKFVADLSVELKAQGHEVTILVLDHAKDVGKDPEYEKNIIEYLNEKQVQVIHVGEKARRRPFTILFTLNEVIKKLKPDVIHSHLLIWSVYLSTFWRSKKHVFTQHINFLKFPFIHKFFIRKNIDKYISICNEASNSMYKVIAKENVCKVVNGVALERFSKVEKHQRDKIVQFVTISRLTDQKNHMQIIDAVNELVYVIKKTNFLINIVGDGPLRQELKSKIHKLGLGDYFVFHGVKKDIPAILSENDVFLLPSKLEGFSIALIEALMAKVFIIASDVGANDEILSFGKYGTLIEKDNLSALIEAMLKEINNENSYEYDTDEFKAHINSLSITTSAKNHVDLYMSL